MPDADELLYMNREAFSERDPQKRRAAIERTYVEDVRFIDPEGEVVGRQALNDRAQKILDDAPADFVLEEDGLAYVSRPERMRDHARRGSAGVVRRRKQRPSNRGCPTLGRSLQFAPGARVRSLQRRVSD